MLTNQNTNTTNSTKNYIPEYIPKSSKKTKQSIQFIEVNSDNFEKEILSIGKLLESFPNISMDTEFPGVIYPHLSQPNESYYHNIKRNVDCLKLIQFGITLSNYDGIFPEETCTWQFNLNFDISTEKYSNDSIQLLTNSGINFANLKNTGIKYDKFAEKLITSGLILNDEVNWISFHGLYDFAYLLRALSGINLPDTESEFFECLKIYFPNIYDVRYLVKNIEMFRCGLSKLAEELNVVRIGMQHQAGSDSYVTSKVFYNLSFEYLTEEEIDAARGVLYGIGKGVEDWSNYNNTNYKISSKTNYNYENSNNTNSNNSQQIFSAMNPLNVQYFNNNARNNTINGYLGYNYNLQNYNNGNNNGNGINNNFQSQQDYIIMQNGYDHINNNINSYQQNITNITNINNISNSNSKKTTPIKTNVIKI